MNRPCPECRKQVDVSVPACPHCGAAINVEHPADIPGVKHKQLDFTRSPLLERVAGGLSLLLPHQSK